MIISKTFEPISKKLNPLYEKHRYKVYHGGRGSAKSWGFAEAIIYYLTNYSIRVLCCREIQKSITDSSYQLLVDTIQRYGLDDLFDITKTKILNKTNGGYIIFEGIKSNTSKIKSMEGIDICWVEEAESLSKESWKILTPTIRKTGSEIWISFNPFATDDDTWNMFVLNPPLNSIVVEMNWGDNPKFPQVLEDERKAEYDNGVRVGDMAIYNWIWEGKPLGQSYNTLITPRMIAESKSRIIMPNNEMPIAGLDVARFGDDDIELVVRHGNKIICRETLFSGTTDEVAEWAAELLIKYDVNICVVDAAGSAGVYDRLNSIMRSSCEVVEYNGAFAAKDSKKHLNLRAESWDLMRDWVTNTGVLSNESKWDELSRVRYTYKGKNQKALLTKEQMRAKGIKSPNAGDALSMTFSRDAKKKEKVNKSSFLPKNWHG